MKKVEYTITFESPRGKERLTSKVKTWGFINAYIVAKSNALRNGRVLNLKSIQDEFGNSKSQEELREEFLNLKQL